MNILFINNIPFNPTLGGIERVTDILTKALIKLGYNIYYLSGYTDNLEDLEYNFPAKMNIFPEPGLFQSSNNILFYKEFVINNKIDIIINQKGLDTFLNQALEVDNVKKITVLHSKPKAYLNLYTSNIIRKPSRYIDYFKNIIKTIIYPLLYIRKREKGMSFLSKQYNRIIMKSDIVVLLSDKYKNEFLSCDIKDHSKPIIGIPNPNTYNIQDINWEIKEKMILFVGRLNSFAKKPLRLLKIWERIHSNHSDWELVFVGDGDCTEDMKQYIKYHNIPRVYLKGHQMDISSYYKKASIICLTSDFEGFPMSLTEGMSHGCIPICFNSYKAATDIIDNGINGCLIKYKNLNEYANCLEDLMKNDEKREKMAKAALSKVKLFDINNIIHDWDNLFKNLILKN